MSPAFGRSDLGVSLQGTTCHIEPGGSMRIPFALASSMTLLSACTSFSRVPPGETVAPAATVSVTFASERNLEAAGDSGVYSLPAVGRVYGKVERATADTLILRNLHVESRRRQPALPHSARLTVVRSDSARVEVRGLSNGITVGLLAGLTGLLVFVLGMVTADES